MDRAAGCYDRSIAETSAFAGTEGLSFASRLTTLAASVRCVGPGRIWPDRLGRGAGTARSPVLGDACRNSDRWRYLGHRDCRYPVQFDTQRFYVRIIASFY